MVQLVAQVFRACPNGAPMRSAVRWDGVAPMFETAKHGVVPAVDEVSELVAYVLAHREDARDQPFEFVLLGRGDPAGSATVVAPLVDAGATWWDEPQLQAREDLDRLAPAMARIEHGLPAL